MSTKRPRKTQAAKKAKDTAALPSSFESAFNSYFEAFFKQIRARDEAEERAQRVRPKAQIIPFPKAR